MEGGPWLTGPPAGPRPWLAVSSSQGMTTVRHGCCALALWLCLQWHHALLKPSVPLCRGFPGGLDGKEPACNAGDLGSISGLGRSPGEGHGYPLQCSCLEDSMDRGAWLQSMVTKSWTRLSGFRFLSGGSVVKNLPAGTGDMGLIPGLGRSHMLRSG